MLHNLIMHAIRGDYTGRSWENLTVVGRTPHPFAMGPDEDDGPELFDDFDLWLGLEGACAVHMLGHTIELRAGRVILIPAGVNVRQVTSPGQELSMMYVHFDCFASGRPVRDALGFADAARLQLAVPGLPTLALVAEVDSAAIGDRLHRVRQQPEGDLSQLMVSIAILEVISHLRETHLGLAGSVPEGRLARAAAFFESNMHRQISLAEAARHVHVSPETLGRLFRAHYRTSPMQYLVRLRMARARELLQNRRYNISQVANACGYGSLQYFSRAFKKEFGLSPRAFRRRLPLIP